MHRGPQAPSNPIPPRPVVASYCADFLKRDMLHIYRQITGLTTFAPAVITRSRQNPDLFPFDEKKISVIPKPATRFFRRLWFKQIRRRPWFIYPGETREFLFALGRAEAGLLHIYFGNHAVHLRPLIRAYTRPVVVSFPGADAAVDMDKPPYRDAMRQVLLAADRIFARSQALADDLASLGCPPEKIRIQRTGIPLDDWKFLPRTPPSDGAWRFFQSCRLIEKKGLKSSLHAFATVRKKFPLATFAIAGDGPQLDDLHSLASSLGIADAVHFLGFLDQGSLRAEIYRAHFFLHPSETGPDGNREGVPNALLEAMASGIPVLATEHGGIPEAVENGVSGILVPERDHAALAAAALDLISSPERYSQILTAGRAAIESKFERSRQIATLESLYRELLEAPNLERRLAPTS